MNKEAIEKIEQLAIVNQKMVNEKFEQGNGHIALYPHSLHQLDLEKFQDGRFRFRGDYKTNDITQFARYSSGMGNERSIFVDNVDMAAHAFFNIGTEENPGHGDNKARLNLKALPEYVMLNSLIEPDRHGNAKEFTQRQILNFIEDWNHCISPLFKTDGELVENEPLAKAIQGLSTIEIKAQKNVTHGEGDFDRELTDMEKIEAASKIGIPYGFRLNLRPYLGFKVKNIILKLSVLNLINIGDNKKLSFALRPMAFEAFKQEIAEEFVEILEQEFTDSTDTNIHIGQFDLGK